MFMLLAFNILALSAALETSHVAAHSIEVGISAGALADADAARAGQANRAWTARMVRPCSASGKRPVC